MDPTPETTARRDPIRLLVSAGVVAAGFGIHGLVGVLAILGVVAWWDKGLRDGCVATAAFVIVGWLFLSPILDASIDREDRAASASRIRNCVIALTEYEADHDAYPPTESDASSAPLVIYLDGDPANGGPRKLYLELPEDAIDDKGRPMDAWGRPLRYRMNVEGEPMIRSLGPDPEDPRDDISTHP